jgi:hypothetical protein
VSRDLEQSPLRIAEHLGQLRGAEQIDGQTGLVHRSPQAVGGAGQVGVSIFQFGIEGHAPHLSSFA